MVIKWLDAASSNKGRTSKDNAIGVDLAEYPDESNQEYKVEIKWANVVLLSYLHITAFTASFYCLNSFLVLLVIGLLAGLGTTVSAHRFYTHRCFKANVKLRILLVMMQSLAGQNNMIDWVKDHRVHHKYMDTNADPHNSKRGFFFAHIGWLLCKKHPDVKKFGSVIDVSDVESDPVVQFQKKYFIPLALLLNFAVPVMLVCATTGESFISAWNANILRYVIGLHMVFAINSFAHFWGDRPYDKGISPTNHLLMAFATMGEGWHNYHHVFPWDYKSSEFPTWIFNLSTSFIEFFAWIGWATDLKTVPKEMIQTRIQRTGVENQGKNSLNSEDVIASGGKQFWGFGDTEMTTEDMKKISIINKFQ